MIAGLWLALLVPLVPGAAQSARWTTAPATAEVGQPIQLTLEITHPRELDVLSLGSFELELDDSWVVLSSRRDASVAARDGSDDLITRRVWDIASLEPGSRELTEALGELFHADESRALGLAPVTVDITGVLGPDEDAPRPLRALPDDFAGSGSGLGRLLLVGGLFVGFAILLVVALIAWLVLRSRRRAPAVREASPLERLDLLARDLDQDVTELRERHYELSELLRAATDAQLSRELPGLTDDEWVRELDLTPLPEEARSEISDVLERCSAVKYAGGTPTSWALEETFAKARRALHALKNEGGTP